MSRTIMGKKKVLFYIILIIGGILPLPIFIRFDGNMTEFQQVSVKIGRYLSKNLSSSLCYGASGLSDMSKTQLTILSRDEHNRLVSLSQNADITARAKWQGEQVKRFCNKHQLKTTYDLSHMKRYATQLFRHLLFDDQRHFVFCFIPKVGCSNMRRLMLVMQGLLAAETAKNISLSQQQFINPGIHKISFENEELTNKGRRERLQTYFKFIMIRNPLERLVSAYRDKIEPLFAKDITKADPVVNGITYGKDVLFFENHKQFILSRYRPLDILQWQDIRDVMRLQVSFSDYVQWIVDTKQTSLNEHFSWQLTNSLPCMIKYHFYGNFKNYSRDVRLLINKFDTSENYFSDHDMHNSSEHTRLLLGHYYSQLSQELKHRLFEWMFVELDFYYHLYPEEQWSHTDVLGITDRVLTHFES